MRAASNITDLQASHLLHRIDKEAGAQFSFTYSLVQQKTPIALALVQLLCGPRSNRMQSGTSKTSIPKGHRIVAMMLSMAFTLRSYRLNRLQSVIGLLLRFHHAPANIHTILNRLGISTSRESSNRHLAAIKDAALQKAKEMMLRIDRVSVLLLDNVDSSVRARPGQITSATRLVNPTSRSYYQLPSSFRAESVSITALSPLDQPLDLTKEDYEADDDFLRHAATLFLARELARAVKGKRSGKRADSVIQLVHQYRDESQNAHTIDELAPEAWDVTSLSLLDENEGTLDGMLSVVERSAETLGIFGQKGYSGQSNDQELLTETGLARDASDNGSESSFGESDEYIRTDVLPEGSVLLVVEDLKSHRNLEAGLKSRRDHDVKEDRLDFIRSSFAPWHVLLNWVWAIFKVHFPTSKVGFEASLERARDALRRGRTALREQEPSFNEAWALLSHVFSGRVRQAFEDELTKKRSSLTTWTPVDVAEVAALVETVQQNLLTEASVRAAQLRNDEVGANARLLLRDTLLALEWDDACHRGDVGRMLSAQKVLAVAFAGAGKHQYSQACLDDIWAAKVLSQDAWRTLAAAQFINRYGGDRSFMGADLYQEHLNKELQRADISHGAETAVRRLAENFSASCEVTRSMNSAHDNLLGSSGRNWKAEEGFIKDIQRISDLAAQDRLFDSREDRFSEETKAKQQRPSASPLLVVEDEAKARKNTAPSAEELMRGLLPQKYGCDVLEVGLVYLQQKGIVRWHALRSAWSRYDTFLRESAGEMVNFEEDGTIPGSEGSRLNADLDPDDTLLADAARDDIELRLRQRDWIRRDEDMERDEDMHDDIQEDVSGR
ncbi:unnamed protein product [Tilletia controversa]|nr:unnamed protein product [Tilletia controversa]CAD6974420.1 unnamed protein product [Tilletia controversa]CAD6974427.1 unnamed protein product [Tilletia controversa]